METGEEGAGQEHEDDDDLFEFDNNFADRRWDSTLLSLQPSLALMPRLTAALTVLNLQVQHSASNWNVSYNTLKCWRHFKEIEDNCPRWRCLCYRNQSPYNSLIS